MAELESVRNVADNVDVLLDACDEDPALVAEVIAEWAQLREQEFESAGDEERSTHVGWMWLTLGINGVGNLFGFFPDDAPSFDPVLAAEGRARGWRT